MHNARICTAVACTALFLLNHGCGAAGTTPPPANANSAAQAASGNEPASAPSVDLPNAQVPRALLLTGGKPSPEALTQAQQSGYRAVISLLPEDAQESSTEAGEVRRLGMDFVSIPVQGPEDLTEQNARKLGEVLAAHADEPVLLHCASGNRAGALLSLEAYFVEGQNLEDAVALGKRAGLAALEGAVRSKLESAASSASKAP